MRLRCLIEKTAWYALDKAKNPRKAQTQSTLPKRLRMTYSRGHGK